MTIRFHVELSVEIEAELARTPPEPKRHLREALRHLQSHPHDGKPLEQELAGFLSYPVGSYRIVYWIEDRRVKIRAIGRRRVIYEDLAAAARLVVSERRRHWRRSAGRKG